jgi:hypothetical protein
MSEFGCVSCGLDWTHLSAAATGMAPRMPTERITDDAAVGTTQRAEAFSPASGGRVCSRLLDGCESLRMSASHQGTTVLGSAGQVRVHPVLGELRQDGSRWAACWRS